MNLDLHKRAHTDFCSFNFSSEFLAMVVLLCEATVVLLGEELRERLTHSFSVAVVSLVTLIFFKKMDKAPIKSAANRE